MPTISICGIDTGIGKSMATGLMARYLLEQGKRVITQKPVQTGCAGRPEDILRHRRLMESGWLEEDELKLTCPYCFSFPGSPHLAARLAGRSIDPESITAATHRLEEKFDWILLEGAGGLLVPLAEELTLLDYLADRNYPLILVTSSRLGSINHTLMSLEIIKSRGLKLAGLIYNTYQGGLSEIVRDSRQVFSRALSRHGFADIIVDLPAWPHDGQPPWPKLIAACQ